MPSKAHQFRQQVLIHKPWRPVDPYNPPIEIIGKTIVYAVLNGDNILTIGRGHPTRLRALLPGDTCKKHYKAFIVAAAPIVFGSNNEFYYLACDNEGAAREIETALHAEYKKIYLPLGEPDHVITKVWEAAIFLWHALTLAENPPIDDRLDAQMEIVVYDGDILHVLLNELRNVQLTNLLGNYYNLP